MAVRPGGITGLIGPNGAGMTTLFNVVSGLVPPNAGSIRFDGREIAGKAPDVVSRAGLVRTFQVARGFPKLSVFPDLMLAGRDPVAGDRRHAGGARARGGAGRAGVGDGALPAARPADRQSGNGFIRRP